MPLPILQRVLSHRVDTLIYPPPPPPRSELAGETGASGGPVRIQSIYSDDGFSSLQLLAARMNSFSTVALGLGGGVGFCWALQSSALFFLVVVASFVCPRWFWELLKKVLLSCLPLKAPQEKRISERKCWDAGVRCTDFVLSGYLSVQSSYVEMKADCILSCSLIRLPGLQ